MRQVPSHEMEEDGHLYTHTYTYTAYIHTLHTYIYTHIYIYPYVWAYISEEPRVHIQTHISEEMQEAKLCCRKWEITKSDRQQTVSKLKRQCRKRNTKNVTQKTGNRGK